MQIKADITTRRSLTVSAVIPGKSRRRPTLLFHCVLTVNLAVGLARTTASQLTKEKEIKHNIQNNTSE